MSGDVIDTGPEAPAAEAAGPDVAEVLAGYSRAEDLRFKEEALQAERQATLGQIVERAAANAAELRRDIQRELQRDWAGLAANEPGVFRLQAEALLARREALARLEAQLAEARGARAADAEARQRAALGRLRPELAAPDAFARLRAEARELLAEHGIGEDEAAGLDHRALAVLADALAAREEERERQAIAARRRGPEAARPLPPTAKRDGQPAPARLAALRAQARSGSLRQRADYILARLAEG